MMRLSNLSLTSPAATGLIMVAVLVLGAIVVRFVTVSEPSDISTHMARQSVGQVGLNQVGLNQGGSNQGAPDRGSSDRATLNTGIVGLRGTLP